MSKKESKTRSWSFLASISKEQKKTESARKQMEGEFEKTWNRWTTRRKPQKE